MKQELLIIDGQYADLPKDVAITLNFQINSVADLKDRQSTYSNEIKLPATSANLKIWGYARSAEFAQIQPYRRLPVKYISDGNEIIVSGVAILLNASLSTLDIQIVYGIVGFGDLLSDLTLQDLDYKGYGFKFDATPDEIVDTQTNTTGFKWPVIDYGQLGSVSQVDINYLRPAWFHHTVMQIIASRTGYSFTGRIFSDPQYLSELIPFTQAQYIPNDDLIGLSLPEIKLKDFIKDFMQRYFLIPVVDNVRNTIQFISYDDIYLNKAYAKDWTDKIMQSQEPTGFLLSGYARRNYLSYKEEEGIQTEFATRYYGRGYFDIDNENLNISADLLESVFAPTLMVSKLGFTNISQIKMIETVTGSVADFKIKVQPRVLYDRIYNTNGDIRYYADLTYERYYNRISLPYFKAIDTPGLPYQELISRYGGGFLNILDRFRSVSKTVVLSALDIVNLDLMIPVYDGNDCQYYYINKISNWSSGKSVSVELIRM
jgi:hypothetical protein